jgi:hypothetical protein
VAVAGSQVYWTTGGTIDRAPSTSGPATTLIGDLPSESGDVLAVDGAHVYWVYRFGGELWRAGLDGGVPTRIDWMIGDSGASIAQDRDAVYWGVNAQLVKVRKTDLLVTPLSPDYGSFGPIFTDGVDVYTFHTGEPASLGSILRIPVDGGAIAPYRTDVRPTALALDDAFVYWGEAGTDGTSATIRRASK